MQALLLQMKANLVKNGLQAEQYTSVEFWHNLNWDKKGKKTDDESAKYENVFVEGLPYRRKVEENGKPLTGKAAAKEEKRYEKAVDERKHMTLDEKRGLFHRTFHSGLPLDYLTTLFDNRMTGEVELDGRKTYVMESTPKPGARPANAQEKTALCWKETTWIDVQDDLPAQVETIALEDVAHFVKGMDITMTWERLNPPADEKSGSPVWVEKQFVGQGSIKWLVLGARVRSEQDFSDYRKFHVDVRLLPGAVEMTTTPGKEQP